jgi:hypothetical protein
MNSWRGIPAPVPYPQAVAWRQGRARSLRTPSSEPGDDLQAEQSLAAPVWRVP